MITAKHTGSCHHKNQQAFCYKNPNDHPDPYKEQDES